MCIVDDAAFVRTLRSIADGVLPGGLLVLRETVAGWGRRVKRDGDYVACYRPRSEYMDVLSSSGFSQEVDDRLATWSRLGRRSNHLWVFRRSSTAAE